MSYPRVLKALSGVAELCLLCLVRRSPISLDIVANDSCDIGFRNVVTLTLGIIGLILSGAILLIQRQNQLERRHGEIVQLKAQMLTTVSDYRQRCASLLIQGETIRGLKDKADGLRVGIEKLNTTDFNRSGVFLKLQTVAAAVEKLDPEARQIEDAIISTLTKLRSKLSP